MLIAVSLLFGLFAFTSPAASAQDGHRSPPKDVVLSTICSQSGLLAAGATATDPVPVTENVTEFGPQLDFFRTNMVTTADARAGWTTRASHCEGRQVVYNLGTDDAEEIGSFNDYTFLSMVDQQLVLDIDVWNLSYNYADQSARIRIESDLRGLLYEVNYLGMIGSDSALAYLQAGEAITISVLTSVSDPNPVMNPFGAYRVGASATVASGSTGGATPSHSDPQHFHAWNLERRPSPQSPSSSPVSSSRTAAGLHGTRPISRSQTVGLAILCSSGSSPEHANSAPCSACRSHRGNLPS